MRVVADSSTMFSIEQGAQRGLCILPLTVSANGSSWSEYEEMDAARFLDLIAEGAMPASSCPTPHATLEAWDTDEEVVHLAMADGLSGAYQVACGLRDQARHPQHVHVVNTKTLCVPHRALALAAVALGKQGLSAQDVVDALRGAIDSARSYLVPEDFDYLRRGGRLTPLAATFAHLLHAAPVLHQTPDGTRLEKLTVARGFKKAVAAIVGDLKKAAPTADTLISVSHANNPSDAQWALSRLKDAFPQCRFGLFELGPAFITQGGPACVAVQSISLQGLPAIQIA